MGRSRRQSGNRSLRRTGPSSRRNTSRSGKRLASRGGVSITGMSPVGNISGSRPMVQANVKDSQITLSKDDIYVYLDGEQIGNYQYRRTTGNLSFTPSKLPSGAHTVEVAVSAEGSKNARKSWTFVVK